MYVCVHIYLKTFKPSRIFLYTTISVDVYIRSVLCLLTDDCVEGEVRIVGGLLSHEGRVEVCLNHMYGTICDDRWDNNDAAVICYQLGFSREG